MAEQDADLFVQLGDMVYNDGETTREGFRASLTESELEMRE